MINLNDIRYVRLGTQDLDSSIEFATNIVGLQLLSRRRCGLLPEAIRPKFGTPEECDSRRTQAFIASSDPSGNNLEILARPHNIGTRFFPARDVGITNFSHIALFSTDTKCDTEFWTRLINARVSDWLGQATFLRIGTVHHTVVLMPSSRPASWVAGAKRRLVAIKPRSRGPGPPPTVRLPSPKRRLASESRAGSPHNRSER
jgi:2,3-dihydroxy-p-cumate/2,3-dihydroxybenzoate 3,4-dioxygenase